MEKYDCAAVHLSTTSSLATENFATLDAGLLEAEVTEVSAAATTGLLRGLAAIAVAAKVHSATKIAIVAIGTEVHGRN